MKIIVRCAGERTEKKCIELAKMQGDVIIIRKQPFGEAVRETFKVGSNLNQKWIPVVDADVLLKTKTLEKAIKHLDKIDKKNIFCLDGRTKDKIMCRIRRAGIHIFRRKYMKMAIKYVNDDVIKPESAARRAMQRLGYKTVSPKEIVFGYHDYGQYYRDLWRKAFVQTRKLKKMIGKKKIFEKWEKKAKIDPDYRVILEANRAGSKYTGRMIIDKDMDFGAESHIKLLGLVEKDETI